MGQVERGVLEFTVDLQHIIRQLATDYIKEPAAWGAIQGLHVALHHLVEIAKIAIEIENVQILLRLYALGIIENPSEELKAAGLWKPEYDELANRLGA